jgi:Tol biopolymer transport system component/DNA-binding winged helix-turn-helix (wHTH) protein
MSMPPPRAYRFNGFTLDLAAMRLCHGQQELPLEPKSFRLLELLIENRDRVLRKDEIFRAVWPDTAVTDNALTRAVAQIRKALDDDPKNPRYIETVPTIGYRFIGELTEDRQQPASAPAVPVAPRRRTAIWLASAGAAAVLLAALAAWKLVPRPAPPAMSPAMPLTTYRGNEEAPSFSPDGNQVAFQWNGENEDNTDIYVKTVDPGATPLRLTTDPAPDRWPAWSPDGRTIAFVRSLASGKQELILIPALGGPERRLLELKSLFDNRSPGPAWSGDSKWILISIPTGSGSTLSRVSAEVGETTPITNAQESMADSFPAVSPDGTTLLYERHGGFNFGDLYALPITADMKPAGAPRLLLGGHQLGGQGGWTPDSKQVIARVAFGQLVRMPAGGSSSPQLIAEVGNNVNTFDISRRGNRLAYSVLNGDSNVWRIDLKAKVPHPEPLVASTMRDVYPQYSPDGRKLAFHSNRAGHGSQVWVADSEGKQPRQLTFETVGLTGTARWSPDGQTLTVDSNTTGVFQVYTVSADGGKMTPLTHGAYPSFSASWSRDGRWIYYTSRATGRDEIWKMPAGGGTPVQVTHNGGIMAVESTDGNTLYFCKELGQGSIWQMPAGGGPEEQLTNSVFRTNFAVTRDGIYYMTGVEVDRKAALMFYKFATKTSTLMLRIGIPDYGLDISPDGRYLAYDQLDNPASDLMLIENFH